MEFKHASLLLFVVLLGTGILTFIVIERQKEIDEQRAAIMQDIGEPIAVPVNAGENQKTPAQNITTTDLKDNQYLSTTLDLNNDSITERVSIAITGNAQSGTQTVITIGNLSATFPGGNPEGWFGIVDINVTDHEKEIVVSDLGASGDPTTGFYRFDGSNIQLIGTTQGTYESINFAGNGTLSTTTRALVFQTWFYADQFTLGADHKLTHVDQPLYLIDPSASGAHITTLQDLALRTDSSSVSATSVVTTLKKGEKVTFIGCDRGDWCKVQSSSGIAGWMAIEGFNDIIQVDGTRVSASEVFEGLSNAD